MARRCWLSRVMPVFAGEGVGFEAAFAGAFVAGFAAAEAAGFVTGLGAGFAAGRWGFGASAAEG